MLSNRGLPPEILDHIVALLCLCRYEVRDYRCNSPPGKDELRRCCLVSKSWISRTRRYLFAVVSLCNPDDLKAWKKNFPDPSNSPGYYTCTLNVHCPEIVTAADAAKGGWIQGFSNVVHLHLYHLPSYFRDASPEVSFTPFQKISPTLKTLGVRAPFLLHGRVFDLIHSFPLLENITLIRDDDFGDSNPDSGGIQDVISPSTSPVLTGSLELSLQGGIAEIIHRLLDLPNGLHFRKLKLRWFEDENDRSVPGLVMACSETLEYLDITYYVKGKPPSYPIDLSRAIKLKDVVFHCETLNSGWIINTLGTIGSEHRNFKQLSIYIPTGLCDVLPHDCPDVEEAIEAANPGTRWSDLDTLLVRFLESHPVRATVVCHPSDEDSGARPMGDWVGYLLPKSVEGKFIDIKEL